jgi:hypothetical protein
VEASPDVGQQPQLGTDSHRVVALAHHHSPTRRRVSGGGHKAGQLRLLASASPRGKGERANRIPANQAMARCRTYLGSTCMEIQAEPAMDAAEARLWAATGLAVSMTGEKINVREGVAVFRIRLTWCSPTVA